MKTTVPPTKLWAALSICALFLAVRADAGTAYIVHEWGTFTSVQGGAGKLVPWHSLQTSELPGFVYNWKKAGMNRGSLIGFKGNLITLQRLETPVIYFYATQPMKVDVDVAFPKGYITEWYPQATQIGPTFPVNTNAPTDGILRESRAVWKNINLVPAMSKFGVNSRLPLDLSGSHYFAARETGANLVRTSATSPSDNTSEQEKFIFYRGAGSFETPLRITVDSNDVVTVENTGAQPLAPLFLLNIHNGLGAFTVMDELGASNSVTWSQLSADPAEHWSQFPLAQFQAEIAAQMQTALTSEGLFPDEAKAMVNTWKDSWFTEEGVRVLYLLPRQWTDQILPMTLNPKPEEWTRVMVGRAEIIAPDVEANLFQLLSKAEAGDTTARAQAQVELKKLGRFAEPALLLANTHGGRTNMTYFGYELLQPSKSGSSED